jgi:YVTN family beta-propeller protein
MNLHTRGAISMGLAGLLVGGTLHAATLIVGNKAEATASLLDLASGKVVVTLPTGEGPHEVAVSPDGKRALVANYGTAPKPGSSLTLIDVPGARVVKTIDLGGHRRPHGTAWLDNRRAVVTSEESKALLEVDADAGTVLRAIPTGQEQSHMVALAPGGGRAFVANIHSGSVTAIDLAAGRKLGDIPTAAGAEGIAVSPDGRQVWVTNREAGTVSVIDAATLRVLGSIDSAGFPIRVKLTPDGRHALVSNARAGDLSVLSTADRRLERRVALGLQATGLEGRLLRDFGTSPVPIGIVIAPDGRRAYVAAANADRIALLDLDSWAVTGTFTAGKEPDGMAYSPLDAKPAR